MALTRLLFPRLAPPPLSPPVINLVTSARNPDPVDPQTGDPVKWQLGFAFEPLPNQDPALFDLGCAGGDAHDERDAAPTVETVPWYAEVEDDCSTLGFAAHDFVRRALAGLAAATPKAVEKEFWAGTLATANSWPNLFLAMPAVAHRADGFGPIIINPTPGTAVSLVEGMALLEDAIGGCGAGARGMIHAAPKATPNFLGVRREGNLLLTMRDTIVCSGSGYSGVGPDGASGATPTATTTWLYGTGIPMVLLDSPVVLPPGNEVEVLTEPEESPLPGTLRYGGPGDSGPLERLYSPVIGAPSDADLSPAERAAAASDLDARFRAYFLDRSTNKVNARARRTVAATWDGICHFAVLVNITA